MDYVKATPSPTSRHTGLLSLPLEVLIHLVDQLTDARNRLEYHLADRRRETTGYSIRQAICSLRLTNRRLCQAASHALLPVLRIGISRDSLSRAEDILSHPHIASGIKGIEFLIDYCPDNIAGDLFAFTAFKTQQLKALADDCMTDGSGTWLGNHTPEQLDKIADILFSILNGDSISKSNLVQSEYLGVSLEKHPDLFSFTQRDASNVDHDLAVRKCSLIREIWDEEIHQMEVISKTDDPHRQLLREAFQHFQNLHQEQGQLLNTGEVLSRISSICARLRTFQFLVFIDQDFNLISSRHDGRRIQDNDSSTKSNVDSEHESDNAAWDISSASIILNNASISILLSSPVPWSAAVSDGNNRVIHPHIAIAASRLLSDVPSRLHEAGIVLRGLGLRCFPIMANHPFHTPAVELFNRSADIGLSRLESFYFKPYGATRESFTRHLIYQNLLTHAEIHTHSYITRCIESPRLRNLGIIFPSTDVPNYAHGNYLDVSTGLLRVRASCLENVELESVQVSRAALSNILSRLDRDTGRIRGSNLPGHTDRWREEIWTWVDCDL